MKNTPKAMIEALKARSDKRSVPNAGTRRCSLGTSTEAP